MHESKAGQTYQRKECYMEPRWYYAELRKDKIRCQRRQHEAVIVHGSQQTAIKSNTLVPANPCCYRLPTFESLQSNGEYQASGTIVC